MLLHILKTRIRQLGGLRLALVHHWGEPFDKAKWLRLTERVCFHKLTYMKDKVPVKVEGTYYEYVINDNHNHNDNVNVNENDNNNE